MNIAIKLMYSGTKYCGWQIQNNVPTIQDEVQKAIKTVFCKEFSILGCSRTDAGVHALEYVCMIKDAPVFDVNKLPLALNTYLDDDISVIDAVEVPDTFHPRISAIKKEYVYKIYNSKIRNPFLNNRAYMYKRPIDDIKCNELAKEFVGKHDFASFMASGSTITDTVRTIFYFDVYRDEDNVIFKVCGDGFLYNMVRIMVGTVIGSSEGKLKHSISEIIDLKDRRYAGQTMAADGLYLNKVFYEEDIFSKK